MEKVDSLIEERKYESAYEATTDKIFNEYIIAKRIELCTDDYRIEKALADMKNQ